MRMVTADGMDMCAGMRGLPMLEEASRPTDAAVVFTAAQRAGPHVSGQTDGALVAASCLPNGLFSADFVPDRTDCATRAPIHIATACTIAETIAVRIPAKKMII